MRRDPGKGGRQAPLCRDHIPWGDASAEHREVLLGHVLRDLLTSGKLDGGVFRTDSAFCPHYHRAVELVGRRWTGAVLRALLAGATRFGEIKVVVPGLSDRLLAQRLKELESEGILTRTVVLETPARIEYRLTAKGRALGGVVDTLSEWADRWLAHGARARRPGRSLRDRRG
jgi:DNA-binding HxlR family transcriptional regulator